METTLEIFTDKIKLPANNMREHINRDEIFELAEDIKKNGLISPITVRPVGDEYELVAGQRRYLAHQYAGLLKIKAIVRKLSDEEAFAIMTSENLARVDVNVLDEAKHIGRLLEYNNGDIKKVASIVRRSPGWVTDRCAVFEMPDYLQEYLSKKEIKLGVALVLNQITNDDLRRMWVHQAVRDGVNVQMAEYWLADFKRRLLPGGELAGAADGVSDMAPPAAVMFRDAIDGKEYDCRLCKTVIIYEGNLAIFNAFVSAYNAPPSETEFKMGGD